MRNHRLRRWLQVWLATWWCLLNGACAPPVVQTSQPAQYNLQYPVATSAGKVLSIQAQADECQQHRSRLFGRTFPLPWAYFAKATKATDQGLVWYIDETRIGYVAYLSPIKNLKVGWGTMGQSRNGLIGTINLATNTIKVASVNETSTRYYDLGWQEWVTNSNILYFNRLIDNHEFSVPWYFFTDGNVWFIVHTGSKTDVRAFYLNARGDQYEWHDTCTTDLTTTFSIKDGVKTVSFSGTESYMTSTGFYYPLHQSISGDYNFGSCGAQYMTGYRHTGSDIPASVGTPVYAVAAGTILPISKNGWGDTNVGLIIRHNSDKGVFYGVYGHIHTDLTAGTTVVAGQYLGTIGPHPNGSHLHFGIQPDVSKDPFGRVPDASCQKPGELNGFVAPVGYINSRRPLN